MSPGVPKTFAKAFRRNGDSRRFREAAPFSNRGGNRRRENPLLQAPTVLRAGQQEPAPERRFALCRRLELALLEIERRKPRQLQWNFQSRSRQLRRAQRQRALSLRTAGMKICERLLTAHQSAPMQPGTLILPTAPIGETMWPEIATVPSPRNENSPLRTGSGGETVTTSDAPHAKLTSALFEMIIRMSVS